MQLTNFASILSVLNVLRKNFDGIKGDRKDVYAEVKAVGYDAKAVRKIVRIRKMDPTQRQIDEAVEETYRAALGL